MRSSNLYQQSYHFRFPDHLRAPHLQKTRALHLIFPATWRLEIQQKLGKFRVSTHIQMVSVSPTQVWYLTSFQESKIQAILLIVLLMRFCQSRSNQQNYLGNQFPPVLFLNDFCQIPTNCQQKNHKICGIFETFPKKIKSFPKCSKLPLRCNGPPPSPGLHHR